MPMSEGGFKEFRLGDLFEGQTGDVDLQQSDINGCGEYFINSGIQNSGIKGRTDRYAKIFDANTITIDFFGNAYYRPFRYKMATHNHVFSLSGDILINEKVGLYIVSQLSYLREVFSYNNMGTWPKIKEQVVILPLDKRGNIDYCYMEAYIDYVYDECDTRLNEFYEANGYSDCSLTDEEQQAIATLHHNHLRVNNISLSEVFTLKGVKQSKSQSEIPTNEDGIPYIVQSMSNNMCSRNVDRQWLIDNDEPPQSGNSIVLGVTLPAVSYQPFEFGASQVITARNPNLNESVGLYFSTVLSKHMTKFSYQNKPGIQKYKELNLCLPVNNDDSIGYDFMENYVNALKKQCIARLKSSDVFAHNKNATSTSLIKQQEISKSDILVLDTCDVSEADRFTRFLPLYPFHIACGALENGDALPEDDIEGWIDVSECGFKPNAQMFVVHAKGESMLPKIQPDDLCVFEAYGGVNGNAGSREGLIVIARQHDDDTDYNCQYTIKKYHSEKDPLTGSNTKVELRPLNSAYSAIEVKEDNVQIIATLKQIL